MQPPKKTKSFVKKIKLWSALPYPKSRIRQSKDLQKTEAYKQAVTERLCLMPKYF